MSGHAGPLSPLRPLFSPSLPSTRNYSAGRAEYKASFLLTTQMSLQISWGLVQNAASGNTSRQFDSVCGDQELTLF